MSIIEKLRSQFDKSHNVWFFVDVNYRILYFNSKAAANSLVFHQRQINTGESILDYAKDTENNVDEDFITCLGKAASGQVVKREQEVVYQEASIWTRSTYMPVYNNTDLEGISVEVEDITSLRNGAKVIKRMKADDRDTPGDQPV